MQSGSRRNQEEEEEGEAYPAAPSARETVDGTLQSFFKEVAVIKALMADIRDNQAKLQDAHERSKVRMQQGDDLCWPAPAPMLHT